MHVSDLETAQAAGDEPPKQLASRRWSVLGGICIATMFIAAAVHAHKMDHGVALSPSGQENSTPQLFRGSFQRNVGASPDDKMKLEPIDEVAYISGEQHVTNDVFKQQAVEDKALKVAFKHAREKMTAVLEAAIEKQENKEKAMAVDAERKKHWVGLDTIADQMQSLYKDIYHSHLLMYKFNKLGDKVRDLEDAVCDGHPCKHWHELLHKTQESAKELEDQVNDLNQAHKEDAELYRGRDETYKQNKAAAAGKINEQEKELKQWKDLATQYHEQLQQTPAPPPPTPEIVPLQHCRGLVRVYGASGEINSGGPPTSTGPTDCRWLIKSTSSAVVLRFVDVHLIGDRARISIFVGPENVALYEHESVISWGSAFKSFSGKAYPAPIVCPSSEVLVVFEVDEKNAAKSGFEMVWSPASAQEVIAKESLAVLGNDAASPTAVKQQLVEKPVVVVHKDFSAEAVHAKAVTTKGAAAVKATQAANTAGQSPEHLVKREESGVGAHKVVQARRKKAAQKEERVQTDEGNNDEKKWEQKGVEAKNAAGVMKTKK